MKTWTFWIDCGGTFTDVIAINNKKEYRVHKLLSNSPHYESAVVQGITDILGHTNFQKAIKEVRLGTTVATNAFLEKKGAPCALITTSGQKDVLEIRQQNRPEIFDLNIEKVPPLYSAVREIKGRMNARGKVLEELDLEGAREIFAEIQQKGMNSLAISLMHATVNAEHEKELGDLAREMGFAYVSLSSDVSPVAKYIARTETAVVDAYLSPYLSKYTLELEKALGIQDIYYMKSDGGLCQANELKGHNALLSGPVGGLVGAIQAAKDQGFKKVISFDMGGTSTDVAIFDGELSLDTEPVFQGLSLLAPMVDIQTVAAGGGSILKRDRGRFVVGPESAGAYPGPACYRNGGPLTVTDANLFLGRIEEDKFPHVFGEEQNSGPNGAIVREKFEEIAHEVGISAREVAEGFLDVAVETVSRAIRKVSIERGHDPKEFVLVSFGGAGGQLASRVAERLMMENVLIHPLSSVLSAYGIGMSSFSYTLRAKASEGMDSLREKMREKFNREYELTPYFLLRSKGSLHEVQICAENLEEAKAAFKERYQQIFGVTQTEETECETIALKAVWGKTLALPLAVAKEKELQGPQVISENNTSIIVEEDWKAVSDRKGNWLLTKQGEGEKEKKRDERIELEIFYQRFQFIAEQMGFTLKQLAQSVNIKERNDFSCALFNADGELLSNAPHIPVHLGSMGDAVRTVKEAFDPQKGDSFISNDPSAGGTHLPDITVITPIFHKNELVMWVASRGHHADIGGITPGSMPGNSKRLVDEGVVIPPTRFVRGGTLAEDTLKRVLTDSPYPVRNLLLNIHDIKAKLAANNKGVKELKSLFKKSGTKHVLAMSEKLMNYSHQKIKNLFQDLKKCEGHKNVTPVRRLAVAIKKEGEKTVFDFRGSSSYLNNNFNTPVPVVKATVLFVLRSLITENIPLNDGILRGIELNIPKNSMLKPPPEAAVVAGNVETSQALCDLLFEALKVKANSQGTMNNLSFGNDNTQYYETIGGGSGATSTHDGTSAVQVNMTNSLLTDPEVFESHYPVLLEHMEIRRESGGKGRFCGGDGISRQIQFLQDMNVSMISQFRLQGPAGLEGGGRGSPGRNILIKGDHRKELAECFKTRVKKGDHLLIETPGGGGYGSL